MHADEGHEEDTVLFTVRMASIHLGHVRTFRVSKATGRSLDHSTFTDSPQEQQRTRTDGSRLVLLVIRKHIGKSVASHSSGCEWLRVVRSG